MPQENILPTIEEVREIETYQQEERQQLLNEKATLNEEVETFERDFVSYCNDERVFRTDTAHEKAKRLSDRSKELKNKLNELDNKLFGSRFENAELNKMLEENQFLKSKVEFLEYKLGKKLKHLQKNKN
jgi:hypothetical protein